MRFLARIILLLLFFLSFIFIFKLNIYAEGEFQTDYQILYTVSEKGQTIVNQQITLENKTANFYADKFELKIGSIKVENVKAEDEVGPMVVDVKFEDNVTLISVKFNEKVIGLGKKLPFKLSYTSSELATRSGQIWEVSIPKLAESSEIINYQAKIIVPKIFGPVAFAVPTPQLQETEGTNQIFTFDKKQIKSSGISMSFGEQRIFDFTLSYYISNSNIT